MTDVGSSSQLSHDDAFAELGALALGALDSSGSAKVEAHVQSCTVCKEELPALRAALAELPAMPPGSTFDPTSSSDIRSRLVARAEKRETPASPRPAWRTFALAASLVIAALGFGYARERAKRTEVERLFAERLEESQKLRALVAEKDSRIAAITGPAVAIMEMSATGVNAPTARMFWDRATNRWTVFAHGLSQPKAGRAYELWLVTADKKIAAGVFKPSEDGSAVFTATYALRPADLKAIAVTEEPEAGVSAPTGSIVLLGSASGT